MEKKVWPSLALAAALAGLSGFLRVDTSHPPAEDAAMLMRYSQHLAEGHGIVWNVGEAPLDGATDFLFMVAIAWCSKFGIGLESVTRGLLLAAHVGTSAILFASVRWIGRTSLIPAASSFAYLLVGPGLVYIETYFGAPVFAFCAALAWLCALVLMDSSNSHRCTIGFAFASLLMGLVRPEGVLLSLLMLAAVVTAVGWKRSRPAMLWYAGLFGTIGLAYFLWRWNYFGHPLPNPFYKKGGGMLHFAGLKDSVFNTVKFTLPILPLYALGLLAPTTRRRTLAISIPLVGFATCFILVSSEMNFAGRFQYALLPMALMAWPWTVRACYNEETATPLQKRKAMCVSVILLLFGLLHFDNLRQDWAVHADGRAHLGKALHEYRGKNLRLATSEAGLLPFYSQWKTLDTWGLNDSVIAREGTIRSEYLEAFDPDLVVFHAYDPPDAGGLPGWGAMTEVLRDYVTRREFILAAAYGESPEDVHLYYIKPGIPLSEELVRQIRGAIYAWPATGKPAKNFAVAQ
ncbi:MAG: hypothetical protein AMXMBFR84_05480 [Candidatus Hydrogenedentota bacterium]